MQGSEWVTMLENSTAECTGHCAVQYSRVCSNDYLPAPGPHMRLHLLSADQGPHGYRDCKWSLITLKILVYSILHIGMSQSNFNTL